MAAVLFAELQQGARCPVRPLCIGSRHSGCLSDTEHVALFAQGAFGHVFLEGEDKVASLGITAHEGELSAKHRGVVGGKAFSHHPQGLVGRHDDVTRGDKSAFGALPRGEFGHDEWFGIDFGLHGQGATESEQKRKECFFHGGLKR